MSNPSRPRGPGLRIPDNFNNLDGMIQTGPNNPPNAYPYEPSMGSTSANTSFQSLPHPRPINTPWNGPPGSSFPPFPPNPSNPSDLATPTMSMNQTQTQPGPSSGFRNSGTSGKEREQERPYIPDIPVSVLNDARAKAHMKKALVKVAKETSRDAKLDDNATELLLHIANDFLSNVANFSCRLASHRGSQKLEVQDVQLYLEHTHGMHISLSLPPTPTAAASPMTPRVPSNPNMSPAPIHGHQAPGRQPQHQRRPSSLSLAQSRPRRNTNPVPPESSTTDEEEEEEDEDGDGDDDDDEDAAGDAEEDAEGEAAGDDDTQDRPRESRRLREKAQAAQVTQKRKRGRPRKNPL